MNTKTSCISIAKKKALRGERLEHDLMLALLDIKENTPEFFELGKASREVSKAITGNRSYLWGAIGIDFRPCDMNCGFCSMGEKWGIVTAENTYIMAQEEIIEKVRGYANSGIRWIVLRTNEHYEPVMMIELIKEVKKQVPGNYEIGLNTGEFDVNYANALYNAGANFIYHSLRLREGVDTSFNPAERLSTLSAIKKSNLNLVYLIEPIGVEHTNKEIADLYEVILNHNTSVSGGMARVPVAGTPLGIHPQISDSRMAHIIAFSRLASAGIVEDICVHPASELAINFGANAAVLEMGAIPRDNKYSRDKWRGITHNDITAMFKKGGYVTHECKE